MALVTVAEAMKLTGKSRAYLYRFMKKGELSFRQDAQGKRLLDTSELIRVFGELLSTNSTKVENSETVVDDSPAPSMTALAVLTAELKAAQDQIELLKQNNDDLRRTVLLLEHKQTTPEQPKKKGFFKRLFG